MKIVAVVARRVSDGVIGLKGALPWVLREDLKFFKNTTTTGDTRNVCIMGRRTFESLGPQLLPGRDVYVVSRSAASVTDDRVRVFPTCREALDEARRGVSRRKTFICGGGEIYRELLPLCDEVVLTEIYQAPGDGDVFFPDSLLDSFSVVGRSPSVRYSLDGGIPYEHVFYRRRHQEHEYLSLGQTILDRGSVKMDRTGTGTVGIFGPQLEFDLSGGEFPLLTTKKVFWRGVVEELLWFVKGSTDSRELSDKKIRIWDGNSSRKFLDNRGLREYSEGDIGPGYGFQWRHWGARYEGCSGDYKECGIDQLHEAVDQIKNNPGSRRIIVSAWNVSDIPKMALPPCHLLYQFNVREGNFLDLKTYQRSADWFLGVPFNIASYALLLHMVCHLTGKIPGRLVLSFGDAHVYMTHRDQMNEQISRQPLPFTSLTIREGNYVNLEDFTPEDFSLTDYRHHPPIKGEMAV